MSSGECLCGSVTWEISGEPDAAYNCHCKMCRKIHGAAFGTYYYLAADQFQWTSERDSVVDFKSSDAIGRAFCSTCGSVVPNPDLDGTFMYVPAGSHHQGPPPDCHIFAAHKAPWYDITGELPRYDDFPPGQDLPVVAEKPLGEMPLGVVSRGSCLCGAVEFEVVEPFKVVHNCFCSRCRRARAAAHATNGFTSVDGVQFSKGESHVHTYKPPQARYFTHVFCDLCGSGLPRFDSERKIAIVPLGALEDDPGARPIDNIFVADKAAWCEITDDLPSYQAGPPS